MDWQEIEDGSAWNQALLRLPRPHILQSWEWGDLKQQTGWSARHLLLQEGDTPRAAASLLIRRLPYIPAAVAYVPKGPLWGYYDDPLFKVVLARLEGAARSARAIFVKMDSDVEADSEEGVRLQERLRARGWRPSREQIQFRNTVVVDLRTDEDDLLAAMKQKTRYNVRLAGRRGVVVRDGTDADLPTFYRLYAHTGRRDGFIVRPLAYYRMIWETFLQGGLAHLLLAEVAGEAVAGVLLFHFGETAWYFYGASSDSHREKMPNYLLQWEAIRWAKSQGCTHYDLWGAPDLLDEDDPMWGVYRFKEGLGGTLVRGIGAWDFPLSRSLYWLYTVAMPRALDIMRRRHRRTAGESL